MYAMKEDEVKSHVFSRSERIAFKGKEGPGPGSYKIPV
jgi:hypothetical protein